jgi:hypothetical protein
MCGGHFDPVMAEQIARHVAKVTHELLVTLSHRIRDAGDTASEVTMPALYECLRAHFGISAIR